MVLFFVTLRIIDYIASYGIEEQAHESLAKWV